MKTQPIGIRFEQNEYDLIHSFAKREGLSFSDVVRKGAVAHVDPDASHAYRSLADLAKKSESEDITLAFGQFLDDFSHAKNKELLIEEEPVWPNKQTRWYYDFAATAHKLAHDHEIPVPKWALEERYVAPEPLYAFDTENPEFQEYLRQTTPREFQWHNLFLGENVLKRA